MMFRPVTLRAMAVSKPFGATTRLSIFQRSHSTGDSPMDAYEQKIYSKLQEHFQPQKLQVKDVSGGCGSMFAILVESEKFKGLSMIKQHRLVNDLLKEDIAQWHGLQLRTKGI